MNKEDWLALKQKIEELSDKEKELRDLYLRQISLGEIYGPSTGYPSLDKPWLKYHKTKPSVDLGKYKTIYEMIFGPNDPKAEAIGFLDGKCSWSFKKLKDKTDKCIGALSDIGVKENENVLFGVTNTPEMIASLIATVSLGASAKFFDIRANNKEIANYANSSNCKFMVCLDKIVLPKIKAVIDKTNIEKVMVLRPGNSLSIIEKLQFLYENRKHYLSGEIEKNEKIPDDDRFLELSTILKNGKKNNIKIVDYDETRPAIKVQSSGTTGKAKTIVHSEKSAVEFAKSIAHADLPLGQGKTTLVALPPWIAYGLGDAVLMSLALGSKVMLCPDFEPNAVYRNIGNFTLSYAAPFHYRYLRDHYIELNDKQKKYLYNNVDCMITGGDKYTALENESDEQLFGTVVLNGYGNNEDWGALSFNPQHANRYGSVGIPKYGEVVMAYDNEKGEELPYGQTGEICTVSKTSFLEYEDNPTATNKTCRVHEDGLKYLHTGDQGYIDMDGYLHLLGRNERVIVRLGFKLSAYTIEDAISSLPYISECIAVEVPDKEEEHVPMVFVVQSNNCTMTDEEIVERLLLDCPKIMKENEVPKYFKVETEMKYTDNNKYDFRFYEKKGAEFVKTFNINIKNKARTLKK